jgi:hypothetical protein
LFGGGCYWCFWRCCCCWNMLWFFVDFLLHNLHINAYVQFECRHYTCMNCLHFDVYKQFECLHFNVYNLSCLQLDFPQFECLPYECLNFERLHFEDR